MASYYTPGGTTACGQSYTSGLWGVANKTLRCGKTVVLEHAGHTVRVPVVDRGPFVAGRTFDLTVAVKAALRCPDLGSVRWVGP